MGALHLTRGNTALVARLGRSVLVASLALGACGDIETTPSADDEATALEAASSELRLERFGIGAAWYSYDESTHVLTPRPFAYLFEWTGRPAALVTIESYYGDDGLSGRFTLGVRNWLGAAWEPVKRVAMAGNVKDGPVCLRLDLGAEVGCDRGFDVALRTDLRVVPAAGFAVANPALYAHGHLWAGGEAPAITRVPLGDVGAPPDAPEDLRAIGTAVPSALAQADAGVLTSTAPGVRNAWNSTWLLATADMRLAHVGLAQRDGQVVVEAVCAPLGATPAEQAALPLGEPGALAVSPPSGGAATSYQVALVDLCGGDGAPQVTLTQDAAFDGLWPSASEFDLMLEWSGSEWRVLLSPGVLAQPSETEAVGAAVFIPETFWTEGS